MADLLRPIHPTVLAQAEKMPRRFIRSEPQVVEAEQYHARSPLRAIERRLPRQRKIRHPLAQLRPDIRPPQKFLRVLPVPRRNAALRLQHFPRATIHFPAHIKRQLRFDAHSSFAPSSPCPPPSRRWLRLGRKLIRRRPRPACAFIVVTLALRPGRTVRVLVISCACTACAYRALRANSSVPGHTAGDSLPAPRL